LKLLAMLAAPVVAFVLELVPVLAGAAAELVVGVKDVVVAAVLATLVMVMSLTPYTRMSTPVPTPDSRA
jgi:hypothetical protein